MKIAKYLLPMFILAATSCSENARHAGRPGLCCPEHIVAAASEATATSWKVRLEIFDGTDDSTLYIDYASIERNGDLFSGIATARVDKATVRITDRWNTGNSFSLSRKVEVQGNSDKSFMSAVEFEFEGCERENTEYFAPGMIYGGTENLSSNAIGGIDVYEKGAGKVWIREDRLPAPLLAVRFSDGSSFSILDQKPGGHTTLEDAHDVSGQVIVDEHLRFGSLFAEQQDGILKAGFAYPGSEGEFTYQGNTYPGGQLHQWRKRYHPIKDGLTQVYTLAFELSRYPDFQTFYSSEWEKAFNKLNPMVHHQDIELARRTMLAIIPKLAIRKSNKAGLSNWYDATDPEDKLVDNKAVFGFTGKNLELAYYLLYNKNLHPEYGTLACEIIDSFLDLKVNPPAGEGYYFASGKPALAIPHDHHVYLRSFGDGMKVLARAYRFEKLNGVDHPDWLGWMSAFGEWVLTQQYPTGGFPRAWKPATGEISAPSPASSYNIIPFLCEMHEITGEGKWLAAAIRTGEFSWESGQKDGRFVGGTIDNPDVLDKEAGTLSLEAYLVLYEATEEKSWLDKAETAARFAETWIYIWNVPMVTGDPQKEWADGVSTVGLQLISTGHSLVDNYMCFDVDEYAKLYKHTGNKHYFDLAKILLHNTKGMLALPGRQYQYRAPGWIQEHWSLAPPRGKGLHPGWLPWVATSALNGICETEAFDKALFGELKNP